MRHSNLRLLFGRTDFKGSPKSDHILAHLERHGTKLSAAKLSDLFWEKLEISDSLAAAIENAFSLPSGWMDQNNELIFQLSGSDLDDIQMLLAQNNELRSSFRTLLSGLTNSTRNSKSTP